MSEREPITEVHDIFEQMTYGEIGPQVVAEAVRIFERESEMRFDYESEHIQDPSGQMQLVADLMVAIGSDREFVRIFRKAVANHELRLVAEREKVIEDSLLEADIEADLLED